MADRSSLPSFFSSPKLLRSFSAKGFSEAMVSPTSILDGKPFSVLKNPFSSKRNPSKFSDSSLDKRHSWQQNLNSKVGLGIVDALNDEITEKNNSKPESGIILFGSQLKIQIPSKSSSAISSIESPKSPTEIKTRNSQLGFLSPDFGSINSGLETPRSPRVFTGCLSATEMELSEDYTCVITHGPNPKTTHIFDNCIVESCYGIVGLSESRKGNCFYSDQRGFLSGNFLSFCYNCKKDLGEGKDIFMYRGEKAFCSLECRYQEMIFEERMAKSELADAHRNCS